MKKSHGLEISEPPTSHGPTPIFGIILRTEKLKSNTQTQIMEAMRDYQMGKMGVLIE